MQQQNLEPVGKGDPNYWKTDGRAASVEQHETMPMAPMRQSLLSDEQINQICEGMDNVVITPGQDSKNIGIRYKRFSMTADINSQMLWTTQEDAVMEVIRDLKAMNRKVEFQQISAAKARGEPLPDFSKEDFSPKVIKADPPAPLPVEKPVESDGIAQLNAKMDKLIELLTPKDANGN